MPQLLTKTQAAGKLGISKSTLEREIRDGKIPICPVRGRVMIVESDIDMYISTSRITIKRPEICLESVVKFGMPAYKSKDSPLKALLERERRARKRIS
jgi:excisionase family DNA binding protein